MKASPYFKQAELVLRVLPYLKRDERFALKGGTALNFFVLNMPRLSVDIDLTFLPLTPRETALKEISAALEDMAAAIERGISGSRVERIKSDDRRRVSKLHVRTHDALIKVEPNEVIRGAVFPCRDRSLVKRAEDLFELSVSVNSLSLADLYGGKLCAALDRQHPRDLFDIKSLIDNSGITEEIRKAFIVYLASHNRPMNEVLNPRPQDIRHVFESDFTGIAASEVACNELEALRDTLPGKLIGCLTENEKQFLLSIKRGEPQWELLEIDGIERLPAILWKIRNVQRMDAHKREAELNRLMEVLNI